MCGIVVANSKEEAERLLDLISHRGIVESRIVKAGPFWIGHKRLPIVHAGGNQPFELNGNVSAFVGEIYNYNSFGFDNESACFMHLFDELKKPPRFIDGKFCGAFYKNGTETIKLSRDLFGIIPFYYGENGASSEMKGLINPKKVRAGSVTELDRNLKLKKKWVFDPFFLLNNEMNVEKAATLLAESVEKRIRHVDFGISVSYSGGLDSSIVLKLAKNVLPDIEVLTVVIDTENREFVNSMRFCDEIGIKQTIIKISDDDISNNMQQINACIEFDFLNPIKIRGALRNYFTAMHSRSRVILSGEGADELFCGYPSHTNAKNLELKSLSTCKSMESLNLDRTNKCGMFFQKEFRVPFLDLQFAQYIHSCSKTKNKNKLREIAKVIGIPDYIIDAEKYTKEEKRLVESYEDHKKN